MKAQNSYQSNQDYQNMQGEEKEHLRKMFIGGLSPVTSEESLRSFFSQWGEVTDAVVMRDPATKRSRGFGFISYSDCAAVDKAQAARPHIIDGKTVDSKRALPRPELGKPETSTTVKKIFVGGLKDVHDEQALQEHFSQFGNVVGVKILTDKTTGRKRGFAFIEFDDYDSVDKAVLHKNHTIKYVMVDVKKSVYKQELAKKLAQQQPGGMTSSQNGVQSVSSPYPQQGYNQQAPYPYPAQAPPQPAAYNGWPGYGQPTAAAAYPQPPPPTAAGYGAYGAPQNAGATWNTAAYPSAGSWAQNGYAAPTATAAPVAAAPATASAPNSWNTGGAPQNFGDYQQTYNGGPQKAGSLQGNRMNPYSVAAAPSYGSAPPNYTNMYASSNNVSISRTPTNIVTPNLFQSTASQRIVTAKTVDGTSVRSVSAVASNRRPY